MYAVLSKLRWFKFSLRTLFILVTVCAVWLAYEFNWIRQRHAALSKHGIGRYSDAVEDLFVDVAPPPPRAPGLLGHFGETGYARIDLLFRGEDPSREGDPFVQARKLTSSEVQEVRRVSRLFPEAEVQGFAYTHTEQEK